MGLILDLQNKIKNSGVLIFCTLLCFYFIFHGISGDRGLLKLMYLKNEISEAGKIADSYRRQKNQLEEQVKRLSSSGLDLDLLDERARIVLNLVDKDEFIVLDTSEND